MSRPIDAMRPPREPAEILVAKMREVAEELATLGRLLDLLAAQIEKTAREQAPGKGRR